MIVPFYQIGKENVQILTEDDLDVKEGLAKIGDLQSVLYTDFLKDSHFNGALRNMKSFIFSFDNSHPQYNILKELIYSEDVDNLIIALTIINKL